MLARKYDNYAWEEQEYEEQRQEVARPQRGRKTDKDPYRIIRGQAMLCTLLVGVTYSIVVFMSYFASVCAGELVSMKKEAKALETMNKQLKIEVDQLKGPERIIGLAEQNLGMSVARSNIYLKALNQKNNVNSLAAATK